MPTIQLGKRRAVSNRVIEFPDRELGHSPWTAIPPPKQTTWLEEHNVNAHCLNVAEQYSELVGLYTIGGYTPDGKRWIPDISYQEFYQRNTNLGKLKPVA